MWRSDHSTQDTEISCETEVECQASLLMCVCECVCVCVGEPELRVTRWQESMREGEAEICAVFRSVFVSLVAV